MTRNAAKEQPAQTEPAVELTSDIGRDAVLDPKVIAANAAFDRIRTHRLLFRDDWLPFVVGVHHLSLAAWEATGRRTRLNGSTPDWDYDPLQVEFRRIIRDLPWAGYFDKRRTLLSVIRHIGGDLDRFLAWFDKPENEAMRERVGHPETLWNKFKTEVLNPDRDDSDDDGNDDRDDEQADNARRIDEQIATIRELEARATTDAERIRELEVENERLRVRVAELERELAQHRVVEAVS
jgi:hypothetical protein